MLYHIAEFIPKFRQYTDPVRTFAYGTDASFYRLNPRMVIKVRGEALSKRGVAENAWDPLLNIYSSSPPSRPIS